MVYGGDEQVVRETFENIDDLQREDGGSCWSAARTRFCAYRKRTSKGSKRWTTTPTPPATTKPQPCWRLQGSRHGASRQGSARSRKTRSPGTSTQEVP